MKKVKVGLSNGVVKIYEVADETKIKDVLSMYNSDVNPNLNNYELRLNGTIVDDTNATIENNDSLLYSKMVKGNSEEVTEEVKAEKKKDIFTKEFVETSSVKKLKDELINWALEQKSKNKFIQARKDEILGQPMGVKFNGETYNAITVRDEFDSVIGIETEKELPFINSKVKLILNSDETEEELIKRWNEKVTKG